MLFGKRHKKQNTQAKPHTHDTTQQYEQAYRSPAPGEAVNTGLATFDQIGQALVVTITNDVLSGSDAMRLAAELTSRIWPDGNQDQPGVYRHVVFDLGNVHFMDSTCIGVFVELLTRLQSTDGRIALVNAGNNVEYLFKLTRLDRLFPICRDVMKAIDALERAA